MPTDHVHNAVSSWLWVFMMATVSQLEPLCYIHSSWQMLSQTLQLWYNTLSGNYNICVERLVIIINTHMHIKQRLQVTTYTYIHSDIYSICEWTYRLQIKIKYFYPCNGDIPNCMLPPRYFGSCSLIWIFPLSAAWQKVPSTVAGVT